MTSDAFSPIYSGLIDRGYNPAQAAALTGNIQQESNGNPAALNQGEGANGLLQWRLDRWQALQDFAKARGTSPTDVNTQLDFIGNEMHGSEAKSAAPFLQAQDLPTANAALRGYIRYGDNSGPQRLKYASAFMTPTLGAPQSAPQAAPAQPMPAYGWSPQSAPSQPSETAPAPAPVPSAPPSMAQPQINYAQRRPPDPAQLQALLKLAPAIAPGFRFLRT